MAKHTDQRKEPIPAIQQAAERLLESVDRTLAAVEETRKAREEFARLAEGKA